LIASFLLELAEDIKDIFEWQPQAKLGDGFSPHTIPKAYGFEAATQGGYFIAQQSNSILPIKHLRAMRSI